MSYRLTITRQGQNSTTRSDNYDKRDQAIDSAENFLTHRGLGAESVDQATSALADADTFLADVWQITICEAPCFREVVISACPSGFGEYQCGEANGDAWDDENDLADAMRSNLENEGADVYELGKDELPEGVDNIFGRIHNQPTRVFAAKFPDDDVRYFGIV